MTIQYVQPLTRGWNRTRKALLQPFDLKKWFVVGFTAFLAGLLDYHGGGGKTGISDNKVDWEEFFTLPVRASEWLADNPVWATVIAIGVVAAVILLILALWLSSRGKFMFLDNVVHDRASVAAPWSEYSAEGNSLFLWRFSFGLIVLATVVLYTIQCFLALRSLYEMHGEDTGLILPAVWMLLGLIVFLAAVSFVDLLLSSFVVPVMYKQRAKALRAWSVFLKLFSSHPFSFIGYGLLVLCLLIVVCIGIVIIGFLTCCIGFLLLAIPYINVVLLLPLLYWFRAFSVEFLEQFGPDFALFPQSEGITDPLPDLGNRSPS